MILHTHSLTFEYIMLGVLVFISLICLIGFVVHSRQIKKQNNTISAIARDVNEIRLERDRDVANEPVFLQDEKKPTPANIHIENNIYGQDCTFDQELEGEAEGALHLRNTSKAKTSPEKDIVAEEDEKNAVDCLDYSCDNQETPGVQNQQAESDSDVNDRDRETHSLDFMSVLGHKSSVEAEPAEKKSMQDNCCVGKSGHKYTASEIEAIISD